MIPLTRPAHTDATSLKCDQCKRVDYVSASETVKEARHTAAKSGWTTYQSGKKVLDLCPDCTRRKTV